MANLHDTLQRVLAEFDEKFIYFDGALRKKIMTGENKGFMGGNVSRQDIKNFISQALTESLKEAFAVLDLESIKLDVAGLLGIIESNITDTGQVHLAETKLNNILAALQAIEEKKTEYFKKQ